MHAACAQVWGTGVKLEMLLRTMGLSRAADTLVGNALIRGISGGERKRVTSAEMLVGPKVGAQRPASTGLYTSAELTTLL